MLKNKETRRQLAVTAALSPFVVALTVTAASAGSSSSNHSTKLIAQAPALSPAHLTVAPRVLPIPLEKALRLTIPGKTTPLQPKPFSSTKKLHGWVVEIPGNHPICTPAYYDGKLYVGGGYGSYDFFAFDAATGKLAWKYHTNDDGPTAAVVDEGCVAFNTESCTVYVLDAKTGKPLWSQWLGDPLMSQPAIAKGRLFMAYPSGQRGKGAAGHALLCADLRTGKHIWNKPISSEIISSPVVEYDRVYLSCMDGTSYCFGTRDGALIWKRQNAATSAPVVHDGQVIVSERGLDGKKVTEGIRRIAADRGIGLDKNLIAAAPAPYIQSSTNGTIGPQNGAAVYSEPPAAHSYGGAAMTGQSFNAAPTLAAAMAAPAHSKAAPAGKVKAAWYKSMDSSVGFAAPPPAAQISDARANLGIDSVAGAWGYQGARAAYSNGTVTNAQLTYVNCVDARSGKVNWRAEAKGSFVTGESQVFSTPSMGAKNLYLASGDGHLVCLDQASGEIKYMFATGQPISFQPALANGNIYLGTANGKLLCINADDPDANGWTAWGGNAQHNKTD